MWSVDKEVHFLAQEEEEEEGASFSLPTLVRFTLRAAVVAEPAAVVVEPVLPALVAAVPEAGRMAQVARGAAPAAAAAALAGCQRAEMPAGPT